MGISEKNLYKYEVVGDELAHYSARTVDIMYRYFPEREDEEKQWDELMGIANRGDLIRNRTQRKLPMTMANVLIQTQLMICHITTHTQINVFIHM